MRRTEHVEFFIQKISVSYVRRHDVRNIEMLRHNGIFGLVFSATAPQWARASSFTIFLDPTQRRTTVGRTPPDE